MGLLDLLRSAPPPIPPVHHAPLHVNTQGLSDVLHDIGHQWGPVIVAVAILVPLIVYLAAWTDGLSWFFQGDRSRKQLKSILTSAGVKFNDVEDYSSPQSAQQHSLRTILIWSIAPLILLFAFGYTSIGWGVLIMALLIVCLPMVIAVIQMAAPIKPEHVGLNGETGTQGTARDGSSTSALHGLSNVPFAIFANPKFYISVILLVLVLIIMMTMGLLGYHWAGSDGAIVGVAVGLLAVIATATWDVYVSFVFAGLNYQASNTASQATSISAAL